MATDPSDQESSRFSRSAGSWGHRGLRRVFLGPSRDAPAVDDAEYVPFTEDAGQVAVVIHDGEGTNVVLNELRDGLADGRITIDGDHATALRFQDVSDQHGTLPHRQELSVANGSESPPTDARDLRIWK